MLFTGHGDSGYTSVIGGPSLPKCDTRLEAIGALDEAQAHLGLVRAMLSGSPWSDSVRMIQSDLQLLMAECATPPHSTGSGQYVTEEHVKRLEDELAVWDDSTGGFQGLLIPGDSVLDAQLHLARTAIRRAERRAVALQQDGGIASPTILPYLNRLSSWIFGLAMMVGTAHGEVS
jgi:cob(I)alamin adenosyltransferase